MSGARSDGGAARAPKAGDGAVSGARSDGGATAGLRPGRSALVAICVAVLAIAVVAAIWAARSAGPAPAATKVVRAGAATLRVPREWRTVASRDAGATVVLAPSEGRAIVTVGPAGDPSLVPRALRGLVRDLGAAPRVTRLAGLRAWLYAGLPARNRGGAIDVTVLPSAAGVLGIACIPAASSKATDCASSVASVSLGRAAIFAPSPDLALRLRLPRVLAALDRARVDRRGRLQAAGSPAAQAALARDLASEHLAAAGALRPVAGGAGASLVDRLSGAARAYLTLGSAASGGSASRFEAARREVQVAEAQLRPAVDGLVRLGAPETAAAPATRPPASTGSRSPVSLALLIVVVMGLLGFGVGVLGIPAPRRRRAQVRPPAPEATRAPSSRPPTAASLRWDAPPASPPEPPVPESRAPAATAESRR